MNWGHILSLKCISVVPPPLFEQLPLSDFQDYIHHNPPSILIKDCLVFKMRG